MPDELRRLILGLLWPESGIADGQRRDRAQAVPADGGALMMPLNDAIISVLPPGRAGAASAVMGAAREVSGLLGVTIVGAILTSRHHLVPG